jgi:hypothetical protein
MTFSVWTMPEPATKTALLEWRIDRMRAALLLARPLLTDALIDGRGAAWALECLTASLEDRLIPNCDLPLWGKNQ